MRSFRIVHSAVHACIAGLCWWVLNNMGQLQDKISDYRELAVPALLAGLALLFRTSDALANAVVEKLPLLSKLLRRAISGRAFVEGDWPLAVVYMGPELDTRGNTGVPRTADTGPPRLLYLGFLRIDFKGGQLYVLGDDWHPNGELAHRFHSVQARYHEGELQYWYEQGASLVPGKAEMRGYTEMFFFPQFERAIRHAGKFLDPKHTDDIRFYAVRQPYGWFERRHSTPQQKLAAAKKLWAELEPRIAEIKARKISADFK